jgi:2-amino-4-hydroxy-6-hydroxymethyldihydropteridine diphosphokinase
MAAAYVGLGSNMGDRMLNLKRSLALLEREPGATVTAVSPLYETEPVGGPRQAHYFNACARLEAVIPPAALLYRLLAIEKELGRVRRGRWGPRPSDLDLLVYGSVVMRTPLLQLPHPRLAERDFVLIPLSRIAPELFVAGTGKTVLQLLRERPPGPAVTLLAESWC